MITKDEIEGKSAEFDIHTSNVQRDYIFGWILAGIYSTSNLSDLFILKGGNCLRKAYFEKTRFSNDLDFSITAGLTDEYIKSELDKVCDYVQDHTGVLFQKNKNLVMAKKRVDPSKTVSEARLYFRDFYGNENSIILKIKLDVTQFDKIYLPPQNRFIIHPYSDKDECHIEMKCVKLEEILASKLKCLLQRRHSSDLYDYVYTLFFDTGIEINRLEIVKTLLKMTIFERSPGALKGLLIDLPYQIFKGLWQKYLVCPQYSIIDFELAIDRFVSHIEDLFSGFSLGRGTAAFFPAEHRNVILEAGTRQCLLEVVYDGIKRIVEPYSLVYKTRRDGVSSEYFYVYDRTGGKSGPGIKAFLNNKLQSPVILEDQFEPRYEIELSKAGEPAKKSYFGKPFSDRGVGYSNSFSTKRTRRPRKQVYRSTTGPIYVIECSYCRKTFRRKKQDYHLNRHKDKYGNQCFGRTGFLKEIKY